MLDKEQIAYSRQQKPTGSLAKDLLHLSAVVLAMLELVWTGIEASQLACCMPQLIMPKISSFLSPWLFRIQVFSFCNLTSLTLSFLFVFLSILFFIYFSADLIFHITCFFLLHVLISSSLIKLLSVFLYNFKKYQSHFNLSTWKIERMLR